MTPGASTVAGKRFLFSEAESSKNTKLCFNSCRISQVENKRNPQVGPRFSCEILLQRNLYRPVPARKGSAIQTGSLKAN